MQIMGGDWFIVVSVGHNDAAKACFQIHQIRGQAENSHHFAGHGDVKAVLPGHALHPAAQAVHDVAQLTVVHIHTAFPGNLFHINPQRIALLNMVVQHGCQQVIRRADGMKISSKVQIDVFHRHHLSITAAGSTALDAKYRPEGRFTQR